jgi:twitching motility protein PilT
MAELDKLFKLMVNQNASDLHMSAEAAPYLRIHGEMVQVQHPPLDNDAVQALVFEILNEKQKRQFIENWELDCSYSLPGVGRFRVNVFMQRRGLGAVFRVIPEKLRSALDLGLPKSVMDVANVDRGLVLVTGPTGSGKSTTLATILHEINCNQNSHIITIEDPIEFVHENRKSLVNQREVSSHTKSFANALRAALREDPDIILVGELRDLETMQLAMTAAETGHLVFGTLHTNNAAKTVDRIIDVFPEAQQSQIRVMLAESLRGVVAQTLFPRFDIAGRIPAFEVLVNVPAVANLIREGKTFQIPSVMQTQMSAGMLTFEQSLAFLVREGKVDKTVAEAFVGRKKTTEDSTAPAKPAATSITKPAGMVPVTPKTVGGVRITEEGPPTNTGVFANLGFKKKTGS